MRVFRHSSSIQVKFHEKMKPGTEKLVFRVHAIQRMFQRRITEADVRHVLDTGEVIEEYPDDVPYPSRLVSGESENRFLHVVIADNTGVGETIVITVYEPDPEQWEPGFRRRKK
jgi:hypothetical protein